MIFRRLLLCALLAAGFLPAAFAQTEQEAYLRFPSARMSALGGLHPTLADDLYALFTNPAGFRTAGPQLSFIELGIGVAGPVFDIAGVIVESSGGDAEDLLTSPNVTSLLTGLYAALDVAGPIAFGYVGGGIGFGFFNNTSVAFTSVGTVPTIAAVAREDVIFSGGYAFRIPLSADESRSLDVGAMLKAFVRGEVGVSESILDLLGLVQNPSLDIVLGQPFTVSIGVGLDAGLLLNLGPEWSVAVVGKDLYTPSLRTDYDTLQAFLDSEEPASDPGAGLIPLNLSAGIGWSPALGTNRYATDVSFLLTYNDILDVVTHSATARNPILHVVLGSEVVLLEVLSLRGGFGDGLFAAGLGLDLSIFQLNFSMFGRELSGQPGVRPIYNAILGIEFRI